MDATQMISDSILESDEEENEEENENKRGRPLAKLCILKNQHIPETELPLFLGDNVLGRDPNTCTLPLPAPSISKQHATICISVYRRRGCPSEVDTEALLWDLGSMNGTRKGHLKLTPNVRYALSERDSLMVADIPCQYVSCAKDTASSQGHMSRNSGVNARLPDASGEKGVDTSTDSKKCVNGSTKVRVSLANQDTKKTPVRTSCLSFEQTPTQPQGSLVPESDSDSDGERGDRRRKALVSDSDSHKSSPTCSTFLSPANKIVPESEDESPITPSSPSSSKNRPYRCATFSKDETDIDVGRQQLKEKKALAIVDDSEEEEERAALGGRKSEGSGQHMPEKQESNVSLTGEDELPVSTPAVLTGAIPAFNMDSDTDLEDEEEGMASAGLVTLNTNQQADQPPNTAQFHMDSDTDVDEGEDALDKVAKSVPSSADHTKPPHVPQPEGISIDSDSDVDDDDDAAVSDAASKAKPTSLQSTHAADSAPSTQLKDFHLDSDTDVDEEEEKDHGANNERSKIGETLIKSDIKPIGPESAPAAPHSLHLDSDTDDEAIPAPVISEPSAASAVTESVTTADAGAGLDVLSDSDTDVEDDSALVIPVAVSTLSAGAGATSGALQSDSDADTDVDESSAPPAGDRVIPADLRVDNDTDVEDKEVDFGEAGEGQIPCLHRENTPGFLVPLQQNCSTPVQESERALEDMETQAFLSPSSGPSRGVVAPAARPIALSSSESQEDDSVMDETQSFILQTRDCNPPEDHTMEPTQSFSLEPSGGEKGEQYSTGGSFQLGLSDSSHMQGQAQALAMESTQAFVSVVGGVNLEDTQAYAAVSNADGTSLENDSNLEEPGRCSVMSAKEGQVDLSLEATQAYISEPYGDSEDETDEDERKHVATAETQPFHFATSSTLAVAETQPMSAFEEEEESLGEENPISSVLQHGEAAQPQKRHLSTALSVAETQPMHISEDEESDDEDLIPGPRKGKAKSLQLEEEQTQTLTNSDLSLVETQPMHIGVGETQPMATSANEESDEEDSIPGPQKRKAKQLRLEDEQTQTLTNSDLSAVETQLMVAGEDGESDEEDSIPGPRKRRAKALQLKEESQTSAVETQPMGACEDEQSEEEASAVETKTGKGKQSEAGTSGTTTRGRRGTRVRLREEEEQAECSEPPRRQTRGKNKALPTTRGRRGKSRPDEEESEEEKEVEQAKRARGKKSMRQQKDNEEEQERPGTKRNKHAENNLKKEQEDKIERERKEKEEQEDAKRLRLEQERAEKEQLERERKEKEEKERLEKEKQEKEAQEKQIKEQQEKNNEEENKKTPARSRQAARRTIATPCTTERDISAEDDVPARRTRSRSNSSNSVSSERSASSVRTQGSRGRGRGRGAKRTSGPPTAAVARSSNRRRTVAAEPTRQDSNDVSPQGALSRSNFTNTLNSEISSCSVSSQSRGRGGRQQGRGRKTDSIPPINSRSDQSLTPKPIARGRKSRKAEESSNEVPHEDDEKEKADSQQASTTRGRQRANVNDSDPAAENEDPSIQECATEESPLVKRNVRGQKAVKSETVEAPVTPESNDGDEAKEKRRGKKRELEANGEEDASSSSKIPKGKEKAQMTEAAEEEESKDETGVQAKRRGRASSTPAKKNIKEPPTEVEVKEKSEKVEEGAVERRSRGRQSVIQKKKKEEQEESGTSVDQDPHMEASEPQTPTCSVSRKRQAPVDASPVAKTPRPSSAASKAYKVLFTGVVDEDGERVLARLGGSMAKGVADMNCLVTDKVRRTVKFLCAVAKGVPIATPRWLERSGECGILRSPNVFLVKDPEQEKKFHFCLQESLRMASRKPLLQGYEIHVTKSVKPEPVHMKEIISCSGATFLPKMPSSYKPDTVVVSCEEDWPLCGPALSASLPVVTAEFILTGVLQQRCNFLTHKLCAPKNTLQPAGGRGRSRKKT